MLLNLCEPASSSIPNYISLVYVDESPNPKVLGKYIKHVVYVFTL